MRLELNNSGAWKVVIHEVRAQHLVSLRMACLVLCRSSDGIQLSWRLVDDADTTVHPQGRVIEHTAGHAGHAGWVVP